MENMTEYLFEKLEEDRFSSKETNRLYCYFIDHLPESAKDKGGDLLPELAGVLSDMIEQYNRNGFRLGLQTGMDLSVKIGREMVQEARQWQRSQNGEFSDDPMSCRWGDLMK